MGMPISGGGGGWSHVMSQPMAAPAAPPAPAAAAAPTAKAAEVDQLAKSGHVGTKVNTTA